MTSGISGPEGNNQGQETSQPKPAQTGMDKMYTSAKAPGFAQMLNHWFPGQITSKMVTAFEQGVMQMITNSINEAKTQHKKIQKKIQERIKQND